MAHESNFIHRDGIDLEWTTARSQVDPHILHMIAENSTLFHATCPGSPKELGARNYPGELGAKLGRKLLLDY
jgi:hypothetical protein